MSESSLILVTGPARSGKSAWAEALAYGSGRAVTYVATALRDPNDREWQERIEQHRLRRPATWTTLEVAIDLTATICAATRKDCLLVDSLGTWLANLLEQEDGDWEKTAQEFLTGLEQTESIVILVAEEVGWGIVPAYPVGRKFRDRLGALVRQIGAIANPVYLVLGGHILNLSLLGFPLNQAIENP
jgi:adenosylcobinamide kinase/adenosylcobinamide-phosphate guanylyltransferase